MAYAWLAVFGRAVIAGLLIGAAASAAIAPSPAPTTVPPVQPWVGAARADPAPRAPRPRPEPRPDARAVIAGAFSARGLDPDVAIRVATCESGLDAAAVGDRGAAVGLWQWHLPTWTANARALYGRDVGDLRADPAASSEVAADKVAREGWWAWTCGPRR